MLLSINQLNGQQQFVVAVKKKYGDLRVCINPKPLNAALKRERYQIPVIDDVLPDLAEARVFTKVDLASAFWKLELDDESSLLTTLATPHGRYRWLRLPFGLCVSSEIFQKHLNQELLGLPCGKCIADDVLMYKKGKKRYVAVTSPAPVAHCPSAANAKQEYEVFRLDVAEIDIEPVSHLRPCNKPNKRPLGISSWCPYV